MAKRAGLLWIAGLSSAVAALAQSSAAQHTDAAGRVLRKSLECGDYVQYTPRSGPQSTLVIVHGSLGQDEAALDVAERFIERWTDVAERQRVLLLAPAFDQENFGGRAGPGGGYRGLFGRHIGADQFVNRIVAAARERIPSLPEQLYLYGHSAGGQFVSRYVVKHPSRIKAAVISAAGTFAFPDPKVPWTDGMAPLRRQMRWREGDPWQQIDIKPDPDGWLTAATLPITVVVGAKDNTQLKPIPGQRGHTPVERAREWVQAMNALADRHKKTGRVSLIVVKNVGHNSAALTPHCKKALWPN
jgi:pimeloyl-ACP methyl ester carboxylesterase